MSSFAAHFANFYSISRVLFRIHVYIKYAFYDRRRAHTQTHSYWFMHTTHIKHDQNSCHKTFYVSSFDAFPTDAPIIKVEKNTK